MLIAIDGKITGALVITGEYDEKLSTTDKDNEAFTLKKECEAYIKTQEFK